MVRGVEQSIVGYAGGDTEDPTYDQVASGVTHHAEVVKVVYDPEKVSLENLLTVFWTIHDPTSLNRQGHDVGTQYRSCIYYDDEEDLHVIERSRSHIQKLWPDPIVTEIKRIDHFYIAEEYHQDYFAKNPEAGYCQAVINPKLLKLRQKAADLLTY